MSPERQSSHAPGSAVVIDGKRAADALCAAAADDVRRLKAEHGIEPGLAVVLAGDDPASAIYVRNKAQKCEAVGVRSIVHRLPADVSASAVLTLVRALNDDPAIDGVLVQLPLPTQVPTAEVLAAIDPAKDVDGFHVVNAGRLFAGLPGALAPCTPQGCLRLIRAQRPDLSGLRAVVLGRSNIVGKPTAMLLLAQDCTVTIAHSKTRDLPALCRSADILVAAVGRAEMVRGDWIKPGAVVIDVGINRIATPDGKSRLAGDVAFPEAVEVAGAITPVPGGVGPMTIACLMLNTIAAARIRAGLPVPNFA